MDKKNELTDAQRGEIISISRQARSFLVSELYQKFENWVEMEQKLTANAIILDRRELHEKSLTRAEFVERKSGYYLALPTIISVFKQYASQEEQLMKIEEQKEQKQSAK